MKKDFKNWKHETINFDKILFKAQPEAGVEIYNTEKQDHAIDNVLDRKLIELAKPALDKQEKVKADLKIINTDRTAGTMLSYEVSSKYKKAGLPDGTIHFKFNGSAGQSFGAFLAPGIKFELEGEANDYFG